eukprot:CAMPEP_0168609666 /NCGR_PEP_ID=MMETSP0449_2-20121227/1336_1 /TAXON_ID=1082188 /ORGANISM="Strombidium rassoulzadegani, Strain ras09" /LENGTH=102 /DNA_ID=CAMNT_0008649841 /DNA_START=391 /DNA_END=696 /DNA_ORIENTATION=+
MLGNHFLEAEELGVDLLLLQLVLLDQGDGQGGDSALEDEFIEALLEWVVGVPELVAADFVDLVKAGDTVLDDFGDGDDLVDGLAHGNQEDFLGPALVELRHD